MMTNFLLVVALTLPLVVQLQSVVMGDRFEQPQLVAEGRGMPGRRTGGGTRWTGGQEA